jgi:hypothetical protein
LADEEPIFDNVLGRLTWLENEGMWQFALKLSSGQEIDGNIDPEDADLPLQTQRLQQISALMSWVKDHEPQIRAHIAEKMFDGWRETFEPETGQVRGRADTSRS